jgi:hypothetical protein
LSPGDTFVIAKTTREVEHLWIILTNPAADGTAVCVNVTTKYNIYADTTVTLQPGDHPFVSKESVVHYPDAQALLLSSVEKALQAKVGFSHTPCEANFLKRIQEGLLKSPHCPSGIKDRCRREWGQ